MNHSLPFRKVLVKFSVVHLTFLGLTTFTAVASVQKPAQAFFEICNATSETVWTAIGYRQRGEWWARGWWQLGPGACTSPIEEALSERYYYVSANTRDRAVTWGQSHSFCTSLQAFNLLDSNNCLERTDLFVQVDTENYAGFTFNLCPPDGCPNPFEYSGELAASTTSRNIKYVRPRSRQR